MQAKGPPGFMLYCERQELFNCLTDEQAGRAIKAALSYCANGELPELEPVEKVVFIALKADIDYNAVKYAGICERNRINGAKGGRPPKTTPDDQPAE